MVDKLIAILNELVAEILYPSSNSPPPLPVSCHVQGHCHGSSTISRQAQSSLVIPTSKVKREVKRFASVFDGYCVTSACLLLCCRLIVRCILSSQVRRVTQETVVLLRRLSHKIRTCISLDGTCGRQSRSLTFFH